MPHTDLILLRAPSIYDSRELTLLKPPDRRSEFLNSEEAGNCDFPAYLGELDKAGHSARIIDLSPRVRRKRFALDSFLRRLYATLFVVEADNVEQIPGVLQTSEILKKHHPEARVMLCGGAASAFEKELIALPQVDGVLLRSLNGASAMQLIESDTAAKSGKIPSLVWKEKRGRVRRNEASVETVSTRVNIMECYRGAVSQIKRYRDPSGMALIRERLKHPEVSIFKNGCAEHSLLLSHEIPPESKPALFREPEGVYHDVRELCRYSPATVRVRGDIRHPGGHFAESFLSLLQHKPAPNRLIFEMDSPASAFFIQEIARAAPGFSLVIAPGSHDEEIRKRLGRAYSNKELEASVSDALKARAGGVEILFLAGLPGQSPASVEETVTYCEFLLRRFDGDRRLNFTLAPFSATSSYSGFGELAKYGFKARFENFEDYVKALSLPAWQERAEYQTEEISPEQLAETTYKGLIYLECLKRKYGQVPHRQDEETTENYARGLQMAEWLDGLAQHTHGDELVSFAQEIEAINLFRTPLKKGGLPLISRPRNLAALWDAVRHP